MPDTRPARRLPALAAALVALALLAGACGSDDGGSTAETTTTTAAAATTTTGTAVDDDDTTTGTAGDDDDDVATTTTKGDDDDDDDRVIASSWVEVCAVYVKYEDRFGEEKDEAAQVALLKTAWAELASVEAPDEVKDDIDTLNTFVQGTTRSDAFMTASAEVQAAAGRFDAAIDANCDDD